MTKRFTLLVFLYLAVFQQVNALHIIGADFTYECLGEVSPGVKKYKFLMTVYRDCAQGGAQLDPRAYIGIHTGDLQGSIYLDSIQVPRSTILQVVADTPACVNQFPNVCVERADYAFELDLPVINETYFITYQRCCRNNTIQNLIDPGLLGATYYAELTPLTQQLCNSSPKFVQFPKQVICSGLNLAEDQSAIDADGDLLVYSLCNMLDGGGHPSNGANQGDCDGVWPRPSCGPPFNNAPMVVPQYTPAAPMGGNPVIGINSATGLLSGTPNQLGQFVVTICVQEFRNGQLLGTTRREFQFNLADCGSNVVAAMQADTLLGPQEYEITSCGEFLVEIQNQSQLGNPPADILWEFDLKNGNKYTTTDKDPKVLFPDYGRYRGVLYLNPNEMCNDSAVVYVDVLDGIEAHYLANYDTCVAGAVSFQDISTSVSPIVKWNWDFAQGLGTSIDNDPQFNFPEAGPQQVGLYVLAANGCSDRIDSVFNWNPAPPYLIIQPNVAIECAPAEITFTNLSNPVDLSYYLAWDYGDGQKDTGVISPVHTYQLPGNYDVSLFIRSPIGCEVADTFRQLIRVVEPPVANFSFDTSQIYSQINNQIQFTDLSTNAARWGWIFEPGITSIQQNPTYTFRDTGLVQVLLVVTHPQGCKDTISQWIDIQPITNFTMPNAFTPNSDSENDDFKGNGLSEYMRSFQMSIWNRWGELVFETTDPELGWNGTVRNGGTPCPDGVYQFVVNYVSARGEPAKLQGNAHLIR
jgi:gliding motility-associated-like protein